VVKIYGRRPDSVPRQAKQTIHQLLHWFCHFLKLFFFGRDIHICKCLRRAVETGLTYLNQYPDEIYEISIRSESALVLSLKLIILFSRVYQRIFK
jgi:hypothetical protein